MRSDWIYADLHMHTNYSKDCTSTVESVIATAREIGLGAIAVTDHNEIKGAFRARELAEGDPFVIVAEEVKTSEGEVIGLFLEEWIPKGLTFDETLSLIKEQGGLVYVPHPFDALRTTPSYRTLVDNLHRIDVIEIYNAKVALSSFNLSAERFAAKYNIVAGAGSDAHVLPGAGHRHAAHAPFHRRPQLPGRPLGSRHHRPAQEPALPAVAQVAAHDAGQGPPRGLAAVGAAQRRAGAGTPRPEDFQLLPPI